MKRRREEASRLKSGVSYDHTAGRLVSGWVLAACWISGLVALTARRRAAALTATCPGHAPCTLALGHNRV